MPNVKIDIYSYISVHKVRWPDVSFLTLPLSLSALSYMVGAQCFVEHNWFHLIGIICGLAIYNSTVVDLHFPLVLYKKLLDVAPTLEDLKELSPTEGRYWGSATHFPGLRWS